MHSTIGALAATVAGVFFSTIVTGCGDAPERLDVATQASGFTGAVGRASGSLAGIASSPRELVDAALAAFAARDTAALAELLVTRDEFMTVVYPELGAHFAAARDTRSETKQFLWESQYVNALKGMRSALREIGGRRLELVTIEFDEGEKRFPSYRLFEGTKVTVRDASGETATLHALGSIIEKDGRYKLVSYRDLD